LQLQILPSYSALMQTMMGMSVMLTWTDQWILTRSLTLLIKNHTSSQAWTNSLGQAPLILCFIGRNSHPTIPHRRFKDDWRLGSASADKQRDRGNGSRLYEVNIWMWYYCQGRIQMVSIANAERMRDEERASQQEQDQGSRDEEASQRGRCRSGGCRRRRQGELKFY
jgi:hypothetical protein